MLTNAKKYFYTRRPNTSGKGGRREGKRLLRRRADWEISGQLSSNPSPEPADG